MSQLAGWPDLGSGICGCRGFPPLLDPAWRAQAHPGLGTRGRRPPRRKPPHPGVPWAAGSLPRCAAAPRVPGRQSRSASWRPPAGSAPASAQGTVSRSPCNPQCKALYTCDNGPWMSSLCTHHYGHKYEHCQSFRSVNHYLQCTACCNTTITKDPLCNLCLGGWSVHVADQEVLGRKDCEAPAAAEKVQNCLLAACSCAGALLLSHAVKALVHTPHRQWCGLNQHRLQNTAQLPFSQAHFLSIPL